MSLVLFWDRPPDVPSPPLVIEPTVSLSLTIAGVAKKIQPGWSISETANGRNTFSCEVLSTDGTYRPAIGAEVLLLENGVRIFGGNIDTPAEAGIGDRGFVGITTRISASDFNAIPEKRIINGEIPAGTLKAAMTVFLQYLSPYGISLDPAQVTGPTLPFLSLPYRNLREVLDETAVMVGYVWEIDYNKRFRMYQPGSAVAPFNLFEADRKVEGDITVEPSRNDYANRILLLAGEGQKDVVDSFTGNGTQTTFALRYQLAQARGFINVGGTVGANGVITGGVNETLGAGATWVYVPSTNSMTRTSAPGVGVRVNVPMVAQFPVRVIADGGAPADQLVEKTISAPGVFDFAQAQSLAAGYLQRDMQTPRILRYLTKERGLHPGQVQAVTVPKRNLSASFTITDVRIASINAKYIRRSVTAVEGSLIPENWRTTFRTWTSGGGNSGSAAAGAVGIISSGGVGGSGTVGKLTKWTSPGVLGDSLLTESGVTVTVNGVLSAGSFSGAATGLTGIPGAQIAGAIPASALAARSLAELGTRSASDIVGGSLPWASMPSGIGTWNATPTLTGTLSSASIVPASTDLYDLGSAAKLWNQAFISQLNAIVFAKTTQTIFGGFTTIGKNAGTLATGLGPTTTTADFGQSMTTGQFIVIRATDTSGVVRTEYMTIGTLSSGTIYNVTRDLANANSPDPTWAAGTPYLVLGASGDGRIDILAFDGNPRIVFTQQGATYSAQSDRAVVGNLNGYYGYATDIYGAAFGDSAAANITIEPTNGFRIRSGSTVYAQMASSIFRLGAAGGKRVEWNGTDLTIVSAGMTIDGTGIILDSDVSFTRDNAYKFKRGTAAQSIGFGASGDFWGMYTLDATTDQYLLLENTLHGTASSDGRSNVQIVARGWSHSPQGNTADAILTLKSDILGASAAFSCPVGSAGTVTGAALAISANGAVLSVRNAANTSDLSIVTVDNNNKTCIFGNSARIRFVSPSTGAATSGTSTGSLNVTVDGVGDVRIPYY